MANEADDHIRPSPFTRATSSSIVDPVVEEDEFSDLNLLKRFIASARNNKLPKQKAHRLWEAVAYNINVTPEQAKKLCERFELNPDQKVSRE